MKRRRQRNNRDGFTLVELLVVIAIIGVIVGLLLPSVQSMREVSRRTMCQQNLVELSLGLMAYQDQHGFFPAGTVNPTGPIRSEPIGFHQNWISGILPHIDETILEQTIDRSASVYAESNSIPRRTRIATLICPSATGVIPSTTCYAGIHNDLETPIDEDNHGVFVLNRPTSIDDVADGLAYTLFVGEKISHPSDDLSWFSGTRSSLRNLGSPVSSMLPATEGSFDPQMLPGTADPALRVGTLSSYHPGGVHWLMGSGQVDFLTSSVDSVLMQQLAHKSDGVLSSSRTSTLDPLENVGAHPIEDTQPDAEGQQNADTTQEGVQP